MYFLFTRWNKYFDTSEQELNINTSGNLKAKFLMYINKCLYGENLCSNPM